MPRQFLVKEGMVATTWFDPKSKKHFALGQTTTVEDDADFSNINQYLIRNLIREVKDEAITKKVGPTKNLNLTSGQLLMDDAGPKIREVIKPNLKETFMETQNDRSMQAKTKSKEEKVPEEEVEKVIKPTGEKIVKKSTPKKKE